MTNIATVIHIPETTPTLDPNHIEDKVKTKDGFHGFQRFQNQSQIYCDIFSLIVFSEPKQYWKIRSSFEFTNVETRQTLSLLRKSNPEPVAYVFAKYS